MPRRGNDNAADEDLQQDSLLFPSMHLFNFSGAVGKCLAMKYYILKKKFEKCDTASWKKDNGYHNSD